MAGPSRKPAALPRRSIRHQEFTARYDKAWRARELTIDSTVRGQASTIHATVSGGSVTAELTGGPGTTPQQRAPKPSTPKRSFLLNPTMAPFEAVAARLQTATPGTTLKLFQPGQGRLTGPVGPPPLNVSRPLTASSTHRRTLLTLQAGRRRRSTPRSGPMKQAGCCGCRSSPSGLKSSAKTWRRCPRGA